MTLQAVSILVALVGVWLVLAGLRHFWQRRWLTGGTQCLAGLALLLSAGMALLMALTLHTYQRLTHENTVAEIAFRQSGPRAFHAILTPTGDATTQSLELRGDEWQLDARVLKWRGYALLVGLDTLYRLDRLSGRYRDVEQERAAPRTVHALAPGTGVDLWTTARAYSGWFPWVDAVYGNAAYLPMADGARYEVRLGASGLIARPLNPAAEEAVRGWR